MNELEFRCISAPLPPFCQQCGLVKDHEVHHGRNSEFVGEKIAAHKFKAARKAHDPRCTSLKGEPWGCNCWAYGLMADA